MLPCYGASNLTVFESSPVGVGIFSKTASKTFKTSAPLKEKSRQIRKHYDTACYVQQKNKAKQDNLSCHSTNPEKLI